MISTRFTDWVSRHIRKAYAFYRLFYNFIALLTFGLIFYYSKQIDSPWVVVIHPPWNYIQYLIQFVSIVIIGIAFLAYDPWEFIGIRQLDALRRNPYLPNHLDSSHKIQEPNERKQLVRTGLLGQVRHPMYFATLLFVWSLNSTVADLITHTVLTIYLFIGVRLEEKKLLAVYGEAYREYQNEVPMLLPRFSFRQFRRLIGFKKS